MTVKIRALCNGTLGADVSPGVRVPCALPVDHFGDHRDENGNEWPNWGQAGGHTPTCGCEYTAPPGLEKEKTVLTTAPTERWRAANVMAGNPLQAVHDAVYQVIRDYPSGAIDDYGLAVENARVWRAVDAALGALGIKR